MINRTRNLIHHERDFIPLEAVRILPEFYKQMMSGDGLFLKGYDSPIRVKFKGERNDGTHIWELETIPESIDTIFTVQCTPSFHAEMDYELLNQKENLLLAKVIDKRQTYVIRQEARNPNVREKVIASNFLIAKTNIDFSKLTGVSSQVILTDILRNVIKEYPQAKVHFLPSNLNHDEVELMKIHQKPIYVLDTESMHSPNSEEILSIKAFYEDDFVLEEKIQDFKRRKIGSFLYFPIFIQMTNAHFFAYLCLESEKIGIPISALDAFKEVERTFQARIMDSNTHVLDIKQNILNVSRGGIALEINRAEIVKALQIKPTFTLDINFKLQAPIRMAVEVRHMEEVNDFCRVGSRIVGVSGDKKAKDIYHSLIEFFG